MRAFSFHIDPQASFDRREIRKRQRRSGLGFLLNLAVSWLCSPEAVVVPRSKPAAPRKRAAKFLQSPKEFITARHSQYRGFVITSSQRRDGHWIVSFGRKDGGSLKIGDNIQATCVTASYWAEALALAEARFRIDAAGTF